MTKYDIWLKETGSGVFGPGVEPPNQFSRPTHERFKADLCELIACYPNGKPEDVDQHALDIVWEKFNWRRSEAAAIRDADIPAGILNGVTRPLLELDRLRFFEGGYTQYVAYVCGQGVEPGFYWCWRRDRFHVYRDYYVDSNGELRAVTLEMLGLCAVELNQALAVATADLFSTKLPNPVTPSANEMAARERYRARYEQLKPLTKDKAAEVIGAEFNKSPATVRKHLQGA